MIKIHNFSAFGNNEGFSLDSEKGITFLLSVLKNEGDNILSTFFRNKPLIPFIPKDVPLPNSIKVIDYLNIKRDYSRFNELPLQVQDFLENTENKYIGGLTYEERFLLSLYTAYVSNPSAIIIDISNENVYVEDYSGLFEKIKNISNEIPIIVASNSLEFAKTYADNIIITLKGREVFCGSIVNLEDRLCEIVKSLDENYNLDNTDTDLINNKIKELVIFNLKNDEDKELFNIIQKLIKNDDERKELLDGEKEEVVEKIDLKNLSLSLSSNEEETKEDEKKETTKSNLNISFYHEDE